MGSFFIYDYLLYCLINSTLLLLLYHMLQIHLTNVKKKEFANRSRDVKILS